MSLVCSHCGSGPIASLDQYIGTCEGAIVHRADGSLDFEPDGYTKISWDSCEQIGWQCRTCFATETAIVDRDGEREPLDDALRRLVCTQEEYEAAEEQQRQARGHA